MNQVIPSGMRTAVLIILFGALASTGCNRIRVVDADTGQPISDAFVISKWQGEFPGLVHSTSGCIDMAINGTDSNGYAHLRPYSFSFLSLITWSGGREIHLYKTGYDIEPISIKATELTFGLRKLEGPNEERLSKISRAIRNTECEFPTRRLEYRLPFMHLLRDEADTIEIDSHNAALSRLGIESSFDALRMGGDAAYYKYHAEKDRLEGRR